MANFQPFRKATQAKAPQYLAAAIADAQAKANARALRNKTAIDAGTMYNVGMGDDSPIYDSLFGQENAVSDSAIDTAMQTEGSLSDSLFQDGTGMAGSDAAVLPESGMNEGLYDSIIGDGSAELGAELGADVATDVGADVVTDVATDALVQGGTDMATDAIVGGGTDALLTSAVAPVVEGAGVTALGTAGAVLPPLLMAGLLTKALGLWGS